MGVKCGGFIAAVADMKARSHLFWALICVTKTYAEIPKKVDMHVGGVRYLVRIVKDGISGNISDNPREMEKMKEVAGKLTGGSTSNPKKDTSVYPLGNKKKPSYPSNFNSKTLCLTEHCKGSTMG